MRKLQDIKNDRDFIDRIGPLRLAKKLGVSPSTVTYWKKNGFPRAWRLFIETQKLNFEEPACGR